MQLPNQIVVEIGLLRPNPWNSNHVSPDNEEKLQESIRQFGLFKPIVVRDKLDYYEILGGQHRWEAAKEVGLTEVPIFVVEADDNMAKRITLADNARYGADDSIELAKLMEEIGTSEDLQGFLPYTDADVNAIFSHVNIALDELDLSGGFEETEEKVVEPKAERVAKTHTMMRFKVGITDAEKITALIAKIQKRQGLTASDELTNAGDALVFALLNASAGEDD
jgi:hypothetical protein